MTVNEGEAGLDALLLLGYNVEIGESGMITATQGNEVIHGQTTANAIEWRNPSAMYRVRERAYILLLRERIQQAQVATIRGPRLERPEAHPSTLHRSEAQT